MEHRTRGEAHGQVPHYSFWRRELEHRAGEVPVDDWLVEQANLRGYHGAWQARPSGSALDETTSLEDIVVGLCQPHAPLEMRAVKLVLRILQSGAVDPGHLAILARRERADHVLHWLCALVPDPERIGSFPAVAEAFRNQPRGYRPPDLRYDAGRLVKRGARIGGGA